MNHEHSDYEHLPTADDLFRRAGEIAVLSGYIKEIDNESEQLRQFIVEDFSAAVKNEWPDLRSLTYTPSYMVEGSPSDDMAWIVLSDGATRKDFIISRSHVDEYDIEVEYSDAAVDATRDTLDYAATPGDIMMLDRLIDALSTSQRNK